LNGVTIGNHIPDTMLNSAARGDRLHAKDLAGLQRLTLLPGAMFDRRECSLRHLRTS
jgi:hypothetical protein